jgi:EKC/KEOPS complex subunit CGI121/TPRKB
MSEERRGCKTPSCLILDNFFSFAHGGATPLQDHSDIDMIQIADAYKRFGISPSTRDMLVVKITYTPSPQTVHPEISQPVTEAPSLSFLSAEDISAHLTTHVEGESIPVTDEGIAAMTDWPKVRKCYKLNGLPWLDKLKDGKEKTAQSEMLILSAMALKGL